MHLALSAKSSFDHPASEITCSCRTASAWKKAFSFYNLRSSFIEENKYFIEENR
jgi:hypothetical protein